jgi:hypothetical protein
MFLKQTTKSKSQLNLIKDKKIIKEESDCLAWGQKGSRAFCGMGGIC